ncbi:MAG TPA: DUF952 domain-containing protein [Caulobacter sp.]|nr:DUF952 domain-containing protein [Caulobacter sp.]
MTLVYKILSRGEWDAAKAVGRFEGSAVDLADGFIHLSAADQAQETAAKYFAGQRDLVLLGVEAERLGADLKWEASRGGALFPHLYRPLLATEVMTEADLDLDADGVPQLGDHLA